MKPIKPGDPITAKWANEIAAAAQAARVSVSAPLEAISGPSGTHIRFAGGVGGAQLDLFQIIATPDGVDWIAEDVAQNNYLRAGILNRGGYVYGAKLSWDADYNNGTGKPKGRWTPPGAFPYSNNEKALLFDSLWAHFLGPGDFAWCAMINGRYEIIHSTNA